MGVKLDELIMSIEVEREQTLKKRERSIAETTTILAKARQDGRANLTADEDADVAAAEKRVHAADAELVGIDSKLRIAKQAKVDEDAGEEAMKTRTADPVTAVASRPAYDRVARVGAEERTYHAGNCRKGAEFLKDVIGMTFYRDMNAEARLSRHMNEERVTRGEYLTKRAAGTGAFAGLVVPQYLTELYAPAVATLRPFADACNKHDLPSDGMTVNISRITTATSAAVQASENTTVSETNIDDTLLTENVQTVAGSQTLSRQAIDRGTGIEEVTMGDLQRRYASALDSLLINQATTGLAAISTVVAFTTASPTGILLYPKLLAALSGSEAALLAMAMPDIAIMHSRRWYWLNSQMTSTWPMLSQPGVATQAIGSNFAERYGRGVRGVLPNGTIVIVDNNVPTNIGAGTNEDEIYVAPSDECHLWEDPNAPQFIRAEQTNAKSLGVDLVLYGYLAYSFRRFANSHQKVQGTGLVTPAF